MTSIETDNKLSVTRINTKNLGNILDQVRTLDGTLYYFSIQYNETMNIYNGAIVFSPKKAIKRKK